MLIRVKIEENGRTRTVTAQEVIIRNLVNAAARRDLKAINTLLALRQRVLGSTKLRQLALDESSQFSAPGSRVISREHPLTAHRRVATSEVPLASQCESWG